MSTDDNFGIAYKNIKQVWIFSCKYEMQCNDKFFGTELDPSRLRDCSDVSCCPQPGCGSEGGNGIYKWNLSHCRVQICCSSWRPGMCSTAATTSAVNVPTQITKPVKVAQTKLVLGAGTRSGFSLASCNCPKYSKFKHQQDFSWCTLIPAAFLPRPDCLE